MLITSQIVALVGFFICTIIHIGTFMGFSRTPSILMTGINITLVALMLLRRGVLSKRLCDGMDKKTFNKAVTDIGPEILAKAMGVIAVYGIIMFVWSLSKISSLLSSPHSNGTTNILINHAERGFSAILMIFYFVEFSLLYNYGLLAKKMKSSSEEGEWDILK